MVWFRETGKGEAFSWLDHNSSTEWWTFDLLVCQKLHQQTNRRDLSPAGDSLYQQWLGAEAGSGWFPLWQSGFLHAVAVEGTNRSFWWSFCWEHFLWGTAGPWRGRATLWILPGVNANPQLAFTNIPLLASLFLPFILLFLRNLQSDQGSQWQSSRSVTECSQPLQTTKGLQQVWTKNVGSNRILHNPRPFTRLL